MEANPFWSCIWIDLCKYCYIFSEWIEAFLEICLEIFVVSVKCLKCDFKKYMNPFRDDYLIFLNVVLKLVWYLFGCFKKLSISLCFASWINKCSKQICTRSLFLEELIKNVHHLVWYLWCMKLILRFSFI